MTPKIVPAALIAAALATSTMADCNTGAAIRAKYPAPVLSGLPVRLRHGIINTHFGTDRFYMANGSLLCSDVGYRSIPAL
jgi:hypothetical protein